MTAEQKRPVGRPRKYDGTAAGKQAGYRANVEADRMAVARALGVMARRASGPEAAVLNMAHSLLVNGGRLSTGQRDQLATLAGQL